MFFRDNQSFISDILEDRMKWFMTLFIKFVKYDQNNEAVYVYL